MIIKMLAFWVTLLLGFLSLSEGQHYNYQNQRGYSQQNNQQYEKDEYPPEPITAGNVYQNPKEFYGQQYGENPQGRSRQYGQQQLKQQHKYYNNYQPQQNQRGYNYNQPKYGRANNFHQRSSGKAFQPNNQRQYQQRPNAQPHRNGYQGRQRQGGYGNKRNNVGYGSNNQQGSNNGNYQNQGQKINTGYGQNAPSNGYNNNNNGNAYRRQNNGYHGNGFQHNNRQVPQPQGRTLPQGGNGYGQAQQNPDEGFGKRQPAFIQNGDDMMSNNIFEESFNEHNAGTRHEFGQFKSLQIPDRHAYGSGGENKPMSLEAFEKFAQTLPYDLDSVDGMGIL